MSQEDAAQKQEESNWEATLFERARGKDATIGDGLLSLAYFELRATHMELRLIREALRTISETLMESSIR